MNDHMFFNRSQLVACQDGVLTILTYQKSKSVSVIHCTNNNMEVTKPHKTLVVKQMFN